MRLGQSITAACSAVALLCGTADAALKRYGNRGTSIVVSPLFTPHVNRTPNPFPGDLEGAERSVFLIDDSGPNPILVKSLEVLAHTGTISLFTENEAPFLFLSQRLEQGPGGPGLFAGSPAGFTGTGSTAAGSTLAWGVVTGWAVTGGTWCNADPGGFCPGIAEALLEATLEPVRTSSFYDLGTWFFHETGFTAIPYVRQYDDQHFGNVMVDEAGFLIQDAPVPALPLAGLAGLAGGLIAGALALLPRRGDQSP